MQREVTSLREASLEQLGGKAAALLQEAGRSAEQLVEHARRRAEAIIEKAQQQAEQVRADGSNKAQAALRQAREAADQVRRELERERAALHGEAEQVREFRDGLADDLGRVHRAISALLQRIGTRRDQPLTAGGAADPQAVTAPSAKAERPPEPHAAAADDQAGMARRSTGAAACLLVAVLAVFLDGVTGASSPTTGIPCRPCGHAALPCGGHGGRVRLRPWRARPGAA